MHFRAFLFLVCAATSAGAAKPSQRTQSLLDALKTVKSGDTVSAANRKSNQAAFTQIDAFFNFDRFVADALGPHRNKLNAEQLKRYNTAFRELVRLVAYPQAGVFLSGAEVKIKETAAADVSMRAYVAKQDLESNVIFHWAGAGDNWQVVDISFDGASLTKDYRNQFGRIIDKDGAEGLLKKLEDRLKKERGQASAAL